MYKIVLSFALVVCFGHTLANSGRGFVKAEFRVGMCTNI